MHEIHCPPSNKHKGYLLYGVDMDLSQSYQHSWWSLTDSYDVPERVGRLPTLRGPLYKAKFVCVVCAAWKNTTGGPCVGVYSCVCVCPTV
jgi:hypothetical protein